MLTESQPDTIALLLSFIYIFFWSTTYASAVHIIRNVFTTTLRILQRVGVVLHQKQIAKMIEENFAEPTKMQAGTAEICVICRLEVRTGQDKKVLQTDQTQRAWGHAALCGTAPDYPRYSQPKCLPCGHRFHSQCLQYWLEQQPRCPVCRRHVKIRAGMLVFIGTI